MRAPLALTLVALALGCSSSTATDAGTDAAGTDTSQPDTVVADAGVDVASSPDIQSATDAGVDVAGDLAVADGGMDVGELDVAVDTGPIDSGVDVIVDTGVDVPPLDTGVDVALVDSGVDVMAVDTGVDVGGCGAGLTNCGDAGCVNTMTDPNNCGGCGNEVGFHNAAQHYSDICVGGHGMFSCDSNWGNCDSNLSNGCEADLTFSPNCGGCGHNCSGNPCEAEGAGGGYCCTGVPGCP